MNKIKNSKAYRVGMLVLGLMGAYAGYKTVRAGVRQGVKGVSRASESIRG